MKVPEDFQYGRVVIFGGSFDPITFTHIQVATEIINFDLADQVWIVPCGMRADKHTNISPEERCEMVSIALEAMVPKHYPLFVERTEIENGRYYPTRELMCVYREKYPKLNFKILIGNDLLSGLHLWDDFPDLISENEFIVYDRVFTSECIISPDPEGFVTLNDEGRTRMKVQRIRDSTASGMAPMISNVSSTEIRKRITLRGIDSIVGLTPLEVIRFIRERNLMSSAEDSSGPSKREELKKLVFQRSQELKKCKTKQEKEQVETKYKVLEVALLGKSNALQQAAPSIPLNLYSDQPKELSKSQKKKVSKNEREKLARDAVVTQVGDGSLEQALSKEEIKDIENQLPEGVTIAQIPADGDCMFSSIIMHVSCTVLDLRERIASYIKSHREEFECFIDENFDSYCESIRISAWGSDIELEATSRIFERPVKIYAKSRILSFGESFKSEPILLSFHERQYSSAHYNAVVKKVH